MEDCLIEYDFVSISLKIEMIEATLAEDGISRSSIYRGLLNKEEMRKNFNSCIFDFHNHDIY